VSFRFQRRIKILPGLRLNVSKTGISWTISTRGASVTARDGKLTGNVGVPGTGLSYRKRLDLPDAERKEPAVTEPANRTGMLLILVFVVGVIVGLALK
jgi:hypothetical protein